MSKDWDKERDAMSEAWYLPESKQEPVAVVGSVFSLLWINRGHFRVSVGDFLYTAPPKREPLSVACIQNGLDSEEVPDYKAMSFIKGIKFAEKMHGIGVYDETV